MKFTIQDITEDPFIVTNANNEEYVYTFIVRLQNENLLFEQLASGPEMLEMLNKGTVLISETKSEILCFTSDRNTANEITNLFKIISF